MAAIIHEAIETPMDDLRGTREFRRVLVENEYPEGATIQATQFDAETLREAENRLFALIELLRPLVPSGA